MRVALFTEHDPAIPCGMATTIAALIGRSPDDIRIVSYHLRADRYWGLRARQILQRAEQERIDLIHLAACGASAIIAPLVAWRLGVPIVGSISADFSSTLLGRRYVRALSNRCERVLTHSAAARDWLTAAGVEPSRIATWRPGVDTHVFTPSKRSAGLRERWQVSDVRPAVAYVGALSDEKCSQRLVSLEMGLRRSHPMHRLIVVGDGPGRAELEYRCDQAVFTGTLTRSETSEVLASADLFVCPSEACSTCHGVLEAQASGLPALVMERGSAPERISKNSGCICRSTVDLIVETAALIRNIDRRKVMSRAAREHGLQAGLESAVAPFYAEYRAAAAGSGARRELRPAFVSQGRRL